MFLQLMSRLPGIVGGEGTPVSDKTKTINPGMTMKDLSCRTLALCGLIASIGVAVSAETNPPGYVDFGTLPAPTSGGEFVEVNVKNNLISMMARLAEKKEPEVAELLRHLQAV